jgi:hypothetical protein
MNIDINTIRIRSRCVERFHPANLAEGVSGNPSIKLIRSDVFSTLDEFETGIGQDEVQEAGFTADRAITLLGD